MLSSLQTEWNTLLWSDRKKSQSKFSTSWYMLMLVISLTSTSLCQDKEIVIFANEWNTTAMADRKESQLNFLLLGTCFDAGEYNFVLSTSLVLSPGHVPRSRKLTL